jgi:hypothetical protein
MPVMSVGGHMSRRVVTCMSVYSHAVDTVIEQALCYLHTSLHLVFIYCRYKCTQYISLGEREAWEDH